MNYDILGQRDPRWAGVLLGNSTRGQRNSSAVTIGGYGCLTTCFALLCGVDPLTFDLWGKANGAYGQEPRGGYAATFDVWAYNGTVHLGEFSRDYLNQRVPADVLARIAPAPAKPVVVMVNHIPGVGNVESHYVLAIDVSRDGKWIILDPWFGDIAPLDRYDYNYARGVCEYFCYQVYRG